jgi:hypothetical protein
MDILMDVILKAGRSAVELALFVLLPVMVVMLPLMRMLEARGAWRLRRHCGTHSRTRARKLIPWRRAVGKRESSRRSGRMLLTSYE